MAQSAQCQHQWSCFFAHAIYLLTSRHHLARFLRVHRSVILNLDKVREMERGLHGVYVITLGNGQRFTSGRVYRPQIQAYLKNGK